MQVGGDLGFRWNAQSGAYELVTDLDLWKQQIPIERFLAKLTQRYALNTVLAATANEGFHVAEQTEERVEQLGPCFRLGAQSPRRCDRNRTVHPAKCAVLM